MAKKGSTQREKTSKVVKTSAGGEKDKELWAEIQKLGGDMADLDMLQDIDTGASTGGKGSKAKKNSESLLQGDLTEFAR
ncbi:hypothetical protein GGI05_004045, partial [Coemansia sp. RSA 2603]